MKRRHYSLVVAGPGGWHFWPISYCASNYKIRVVTLVMFRKFFGHDGKLIWHKDGFMAEAKDGRGNEISVVQIHNDPKLKEEA